MEEFSLKDTPSFIETQFPVAKVSAESYKERKAGGSQTLVGLGNWKGRKPLVLVRAALLGMLLPSTSNPVRDREIFLKLMTMDEDGLRMRKDKAIAPDRLSEIVKELPNHLRSSYLTGGDKLRQLESTERASLQQLAFGRMPYSEKLTYCQRPEHLDGPEKHGWAEINAHLSTDAHSLQELVLQLGVARFGHIPRVGDAFAGGGSIPFEAARLGAEAFASDLNPLAGLLTWASLNIIGGGKKVVEDVNRAQREVFEEVDKQVTALGVEYNSQGWRADAYLYCVEVNDPESGWKIPLLPSFVISDANKVIVKLVAQPANKSYAIEVIESASEAEYKQALKGSTVADSRIVPPGGGFGARIDEIRRNMRQWENSDITSRPEDVFVERLYCVRWVNNHGKRVYRGVDDEDLAREQKVIDFVKANFVEWQKQGYIPNRRIESGYNTDQPNRERGYTFWHHLFTPRQLLLAGLLSQAALTRVRAGLLTPQQAAGLATGLGRVINLLSRLCMWHKGRETLEQTFSNQALNTLFTFGNRGLILLKEHYEKTYDIYSCELSDVTVQDGRLISEQSDLWITDPPYADAVNYDEISEFFLAWQAPYIEALFPTWPTDSRRELAVRGKDEVFKQSMVSIYRRLNQNMPENGMQLVMFTHTSPAVWADLASILWAAGLRVTAAWTIATETDSIGLKSGNNVQGTVLLVLRKRTNHEEIFLDQVQAKVEREVIKQLKNMTALDDNSDPNFSDSDYQLAAYAAALRVITTQPIAEIKPEREILITRGPKEVGPIEEIIRQAVAVACENLVPRDIGPNLWRNLKPMERFYIKGLEVETNGERRAGVYQELARGFGANDYTQLLESGKANQTRLRTASEFQARFLGNKSEFGDGLLRQCLFAIYTTGLNSQPKDGMNYLKTELVTYWDDRPRILEILDWIARLRNVQDLPEWSKDGENANLLAGAVRNDHV
jgi:putative DNA methylase